MKMTRSEISWILYDCANSAYSIIITTAVLPIFFKQSVATGLPSYEATAWWGYVNTAYTLVLMLLAPWLGVMADIRYYKKRLMIGFIVLGVSSSAALMTIQSGEWIQCLSLYFFSAIGFAGANIFYDAFLSDITSPERKDWLSANGFAWGYLASAVPYLLTMIALSHPEWFGLADVAQAARYSFLLTAFWWALFSIPIILHVTQRYYIIHDDIPLIRYSVRRLWQTIRSIPHYRPVFLFLLAYFFYIDGVDTIIKMAAIYGIDIGIDSADLLLILLVVQLVAFPFALIYGRLARYWGARRMIYLAIGVYCFITVLAYFVHTTWQYWVLALLVATSQGGIQALSRSYFSSLIPPERSSEFFGFYNIFGRFAAILGPFLVGFFTQISQNTRLGILALIILFILGAVLLSRVPICNNAVNSHEN